MSLDLSKYVKKLNIEAPKQLQLEIIEDTLKQPNVATVEQELLKPFWNSKGYRDLNFPEHKFSDYEYGRAAYLLRGQTDLDWTWEADACSKKVRDLIESLDFIESLSRVLCVLQIPGEAVPAHRDLILGSTYNTLEDCHSTFWGDNEVIYRGDPFLDKHYPIQSTYTHQDNRFFGLRCPLSEKDRNGLPFISDRTRKLKTHYDMGNHFFLLNEASLDHGADPVDYHRGVLIIDGQLNMQEVHKHLL